MKSLLLLSLGLLATHVASGQDIASYLYGDGTRQWELRSIEWNDGSELESQEFGEGQDDEFTEENDEATTIPETIIFRSDGTCSLSYVAYFDDTDGDDDEDLVDKEWWLEGTWTVSGYNIKIRESNGYTWTLTNVQPDAENEEFNAGYDYGGFNSGIKSLGYFMDEW